MSGSISFFVSALVGYYLLHAVTLGGPTNIGTAAVVAAATAVVEGVSGGMDNLLVPLTAYSLSQHLL